jgi:hypothetical protein
MKRGRNAAARLRNAVDMLPVETKQAMLLGLEQETIVTGAYTLDGGVCPMLAAHRRGGRTEQAAFARCWDRYTGAGKGRVATERELRTLRVMLEASLDADQPPLRDVELPKAGAKHDTGERNRAPELRRRHGWAWSRLFRRYDTYVAHLAALEDREAADGVASRRPSSWRTSLASTAVVRLRRSSRVLQTTSPSVADWT